MNWFSIFFIYIVFMFINLVIGYSSHLYIKGGWNVYESLLIILSPITTFYLIGHLLYKKYQTRADEITILNDMINELRDVIDLYKEVSNYQFTDKDWVIIIGFLRYLNNTLDDDDLIPKLNDLLKSFEDLNIVKKGKDIYYTIDLELADEYLHQQGWED